MSEIIHQPKEISLQVVSGKSQELLESLLNFNALRKLSTKDLASFSCHVSSTGAPVICAKHATTDVSLTSHYKKETLVLLSELLAEYSGISINSEIGQFPTNGKLWITAGVAVGRLVDGYNVLLPGGNRYAQNEMSYSYLRQNCTVFLLKEQLMCII